MLKKSRLLYHERALKLRAVCGRQMHLISYKKREGYRLEQTATLQLQKVTGSQDDRGKEKREHELHSEGSEIHRSFASRYKAWFGKNTVQALAPG